MRVPVKFGGSLKLVLLVVFCFVGGERQAVRLPQGAVVAEEASVLL